MSRAIVFLSLAFFVFASAASLSWYLQYKQQSDEENPSAEGEKPAKKKTGSASLKAGDSRGKGPIIRPPESPEAARVMKFADSLKKQEDLLKEREGHLVVREKQMGLIHDEIKKDQQKLASIRKDVQAELQLVLEKLDALEKRTAAASGERQKAKNQLDDLAKATLELNLLENKNLKQLAEVYNKMEPDAAANSIVQLANAGKLETAVVILANMASRNAAAVLSEISKQGEGVETQIYDRMRYLKTPTPPTQK